MQDTENEGLRGIIVDIESKWKTEQPWRRSCSDSEESNESFESIKGGKYQSDA